MVIGPQVAECPLLRRTEDTLVNTVTSWSSPRLQEPTVRSVSSSQAPHIAMYPGSQVQTSTNSAQIQTSALSPQKALIPQFPPHEVGIHGHKHAFRDISGSRKLLLKAFLVFPFIKQSELINQNSIYRRHTASNNRFEWPVCSCDYFIFHANLNTRRKGYAAQDSAQLGD